jgi:SAM-dependent methyltransferase
VGDREAMNCSACGSSALSPHLSVRGETGDQGLIPTTDAYGTALGDIVRCGDCGHMQLDRFPTDEELLVMYEDAESDDYVEEEAGQRLTAQVALERIERWVPEKGRLLDLGCWVGFLLAEARDRGWQVVGVEPSEFAAGYARDQHGLEILEQDLLSADLPAAAFDAIVLGDVIEHLTDPLATLEHIATLLTPGGVLYLTVPDSGSRLARALGRHWWSVIPTHLQYFSRHSLALLLRRAGYEPLELTTAPKTFSVRYYLGRLSGYSPALAAALTSAFARIGLADRLWTPDFRDRMAVVAQR